MKPELTGTLPLEHRGKVTDCLFIIYLMEAVPKKLLILPIAIAQVFHIRDLN